MIQNLDRNKAYHDLVGNPLGEDLLVIALTKGCVLELRPKLDIEQKEVSCREVRDYVVAYIERRRDAFFSTGSDGHPERGGGRR